MNYRAEIDGLRALAVVPVILFHAGFENFSGGFVGVDIFFVISGYLITTIIVNEIIAGKFSLVNFYERRARRILPALYVIALITAVFASVILLPTDLISFGKSLISIPVFSSNFFFWSERGYFGPSTELKPMVHTWSLAVEEQFYIIYPLLLLFLISKRTLLTVVMLSLFILSLALSWYLTKLHFETAFYLPFARAWELFAGGFAAFYMLRNYKALPRALSDVLTFVGVGLIFFAIFTFDSSTPFPSLNAAYPVTGTVMIIVSSGNAVYLKRLLSLKPMVKVGLLSYSLYLIHQPVFALARHLDRFEGNEITLIIACLALAWLSFRFVEAPFRSKNRIAAITIFKLAAITSVVVMCVGLFFVQSRGLISKYDTQDQKIMAQFSALSTYNMSRFYDLEMIDFSENKTNILLVGDSHARDILNVLVEGKYLDDVSIVTKRINDECGNLYLPDYTQIQVHIPLARQARCEVLGRFESPRMQELANQADEIWLVSSWRDWVVEYLPQTIEALENDFDVTVRVFGTKNFGKIRQKEILGIDESARRAFTHKVNELQISVNDLMGDKLGEKYNYYELLASMCGGDPEQCRIFNNRGELISTDGGHLTLEGAIAVAERLRPILSSIFEEM